MPLAPPVRWASWRSIVFSWPEEGIVGEQAERALAGPLAHFYQCHPPPRALFLVFCFHVCRFCQIGGHMSEPGLSLKPCVTLGGVVLDRLLNR